MSKIKTPADYYRDIYSAEADYEMVGFAQAYHEYAMEQKIEQVGRNDYEIIEQNLVYGLKRAIEILKK